VIEGLLGFADVLEAEGDSEVGFIEQRRRMGMWNAIVELRTRSRKKRYCSISGWA
jgi:hypothetical protein